MLTFRRSSYNDHQMRRDAATAQRILRRMIPIGGYVCCSSTLYRPYRIITTSRVLAIYADGGIYQSGVPATANSERIDPHAHSAEMTRAHCHALANAAAARLRRDFKRMREALTNARIIRTATRPFDFSQQLQEV